MATHLYRMGTGNGGGTDIKPYEVRFTCASGYIGQTLTMHYTGTPHAGEVVEDVSGAFASDGTLTLYPMHSGTWKCSCYSTVTSSIMDKTIDLSYWGITNVEKFEDIPDGSAETTDIVSTWLHCGNVWDKDSYTLSQICSETETLTKLLSETNANTYLLRSTTWASTLCSNTAFEAQVELSYCDTLVKNMLKISTWKSAIIALDESKMKKFLTVFVPTLSGDNSKVFASSEQSTYPKWKAFDGSIAYLDGWACSGVTVPQYIGYQFDNDVIVACIKYTNFMTNTKTFKIQYGDSFSDASNSITASTDATKWNKVSVNESGKESSKWIAYITEKNGSTSVGFYGLQFYGR